ncbi:erythromycin esterase family protein [Hoyosella altamirensis]|uniref:Erythromycin esterase-like protein n=1 Tax=Hoyosella altamirensis TaxID=616997 RepID=A0A839RR97_9ACTN|nr:erythromycin esterase family protein [Hoyosella altamirensis]MBB3038849.1 erythromycin esterase-like protein [Hoyosella altamirensis]
MTPRTLLQDGCWELTGDGTTAPFSKFLDSLPTRPRLLGFGECMHEEEGLPRLRNLLFQYLVEHEGYRSVAVESDCLAGLLADSFVVNGTGSLDEAMEHGFSHGFGDSPANRALIQWMRAYNRDRPLRDRLRFFGFDAPVEMTGGDSPRLVLSGLYQLLADHVDPALLPCSHEELDQVIGKDDQWTNPEAALDPSLSIGSSPDARHLRLITDDLVALLYSESPQLAASLSADEWWRARLYGRTALGLLRYHAAVADSSVARVPRLLGLRDELMASNLQAIVAREMTRGPTLAFAHNRHLQKYKSHWVFEGQDIEWWSAGAIVDVQLGRDYAFLATALGTAPHHDLGAPSEHTLEGVLAAALAENRTVMNSTGLRKALESAGIYPEIRTETSANLSYFALDPKFLHLTDGIVYIKELFDEARA